MGARPARDLQEMLARLVVSGSDRKEARVGLDRARVVVEALIAQLGDSAEELAAVGDLGHALEADLEDAYELPRVVSRDIHALENDCSSRTERRHVEALLDDVARLAARRVRLEDVLEFVERELRLVEPRESQRAESQLEDERVARSRLFDAVLEELSQLRPTLLRPVERVESSERRDCSWFGSSSRIRS
jgi:hypothetical protein